MELVIRIPDALYNTCKITSKMNGENEVADILIDAVANGTPLPKGHGRLIDADRLRSMYSINRANFNTVVGIQKWIDDAPTIIEADKAENKEYGVNVINCNATLQRNGSFGTESGTTIHAVHAEGRKE